jgi:hypothetical protein
MQKFRIIGFFCENRLHWQSEVGNNSKNGCFRLHIYLRITKTLVHNSLYVFDKQGKNLSHKKMQYSYSKKMFTGRAETIWIIGDPDNQLPYKWSSTVQRC